MPGSGDVTVRRGSLRAAALLLVLTLGTARATAETRHIAGVAPDGSDGGPVPMATFDEITPEERRAIQSRIAANVRALRQRGVAPQGAVGPVRLAWPLRPAPGFTGFGYHAITQLVDHDPAYPDPRLDYACGTRTYDLPNGYNHAGTDFVLWPFGWLKMEAGQIEIVAAAAGTIVEKSDGQFDRNCAFEGSTWNAVYVEHGDGSIAWYGHMKRDSLTQKGIGEPVEEGEYLGLVGSSGNSNTPHLHLEVYDAESNLIDPFQGLCNTLNFESWWISQPPYYDSAINEITTATAHPVFPACPEVETSNARDSFYPGDQILFTSYYRDQLSSQTSEHTIYRPDGSTFSSWTHQSPDPHSLGTYWAWRFDQFAPEGPVGTWLYEIVYNGLIYRHEFTLTTDLPTSTTTPPPLSTTTTAPTTTTQPCTTLRCSLDAAIRAACPGEPVPSSVTNKLDRALSLIEQALSAPTRGKTLRRKAKGALKAAARAARKAARGRRPTLSGTCAAGIRDAATVIIHRL